MYLLVFHLLTVSSFHIHHQIPQRFLHLKNDKLLEVDKELNNEKQKIKKLLIKFKILLIQIKNLSYISIHQYLLLSNKYN